MKTTQAAWDECFYFAHVLMIMMNTYFDWEVTISQGEVVRIWAMVPQTPKQIQATYVETLRHYGSPDTIGRLR